MKYKTEENFIVKNPKYNIIYHALLKEERIWNSMGQYWLSRECSNRAARLLNGDIEDLKYPLKSEELFYKTKKFL